MGGKESGEEGWSYLLRKRNQPLGVARPGGRERGNRSSSSSLIVGVNALSL